MIVKSLVNEVINNALTTKSHKDRSVLGKDDFLKLLLMQLKHQDPLKGMDPTEQISQMAQFSSLEALENMNKSLSELITISNISKAASLVGKNVKVIKGDNEITGKVDKVLIENGKSFVLVNNEKFLVSDIKEVF